MAKAFPSYKLQIKRVKFIVRNAQGILMEKMEKRDYRKKQRLIVLPRTARGQAMNFN